jgi:CRISPR-associated protein Cmr2
MFSDYFIEINDKIRPLIEEIENLDKKIKAMKEQIKKLKGDKSAQSQSKILKLKEEQKVFEDERRQKWNEAYNLTPYFWSHWKALSSLYLAENDSSIAKLVRDRYVELQYREGSQRINKEIENNHLTNFLETFKTPKTDISLLPPYSFFLRFTFTLATPYLSKDDEEFYIIDNSVRKDKVFKVPMVSGSTWKGNMRWTAKQIINDSYKIEKLFGNDKDEKKNFRRGRLNFYPTFFDKIGLEVINPHDRKTGVNPIV